MHKSYGGWSVIKTFYQIKYVNITANLQTGVTSY